MCPTRWLLTPLFLHVLTSICFSFVSLSLPQPLCVFYMFVCIFTLKLNKAIYKALNTRSLCLSVFLIVPVGYFDVSLFLNCVALSLNYPYLSFFPTPIINTTFPWDPLPTCSVTPQPLLLLLSYHHQLFDTNLYIPLSLSVVPQLSHFLCFPFSLFPLPCLPSFYPPLLSFHLHLPSSSLLHLPLTVTSSIHYHVLSIAKPPKGVRRAYIWIGSASPTLPWE